MMKSRLLLLILGVALAASANCATIDEVRSGPLQVQASISGAVTYLEPLECYVESADRSGGIRVLGSTTGLAIGSLVTATGIYDVIDGEPCIRDATITPQTGSANISPFGMPNAAITGPLTWLRVQDYKRTPAPGGWTYEWVRAAGAANTGLLVKTWGKVDALYYSPVSLARWFYLDDGYSAVSDYGDMGVLVYSDAEVNRGDFVSVTGISSVEPTFDSAERLVRVLRTRSADDVQVERPAPLPGPPYSDEFNGPDLAPIWMFYFDPVAPASISLTQEPGCLALTTECITQYPYPEPQITQFAPRAWQCDVKMRVAFAKERFTFQSISLRLATGPAVHYVSPQQYVESFQQLVDVRYDGCAATTTVVFGNTQTTAMPMQGDTCHLRIRSHSWSMYVLYASVSFDGVNYTSEVPVGGGASVDYLAIVTRSLNLLGQPAPPFTAYIDYIRFTRVQ